MKKFCILLIITILGIILSSGCSMACHEEAMGGELGIGPTLKGHNPSTRVNGFLVITESTTAVSSTSTSCDAYIGFLDKNYYQIAANVAKGEGIFLDALMSVYGCSTIESKNAKTTVTIAVKSNVYRLLCIASFPSFNICLNYKPINQSCKSIYK